MSELATADANPPLSKPLPPPPPPPRWPHLLQPRHASLVELQGKYNTEAYVIAGVGSIGPLLDDIMEALIDTNIHKMGVCGKHGEQMDSLLETVKRRVTRDCFFGVTVMVSIGKNPDLTRIQQGIAGVLGLCFQGQGKGKKTAFWTFWASWLSWPGINSSSKNKDVGKKARQLYDWIMLEPKILFILCDLQERLDLEELGIPFAAVHPGCKLILTSE